MANYNRGLSPNFLDQQIRQMPTGLIREAA